MKERFYEKLSDLSLVYDNVKCAVLLAESFDSKQEMYVGPMNELRNALDHIFRAIKVEDETACDEILKGARAHMVRAGNDALELLYGNLGASARNKLIPYNTETLTAVFPDYYTSIRPKISELQQRLAEIRMKGKNAEDYSAFFHTYFGKIDEFVQINESIDRMLPSLQEFSDKRSKEERKKYYIGLIGIVSGALVTWLLTKLAIFC